MPGWYGTVNDAKATLLMDYASALEKRAFINPSKVALEECLQFRWVEGRVEHATEKNAVDDSAARESHADHVIADGLAWMLVEDKGGPAGSPAVPDPEPPVLSWEWRRKMGMEADDAAAAATGGKADGAHHSRRRDVVTAQPGRAPAERFAVCPCAQRPLSPRRRTWTTSAWT
jgi:hypothetical protein